MTAAVDTMAWTGEQPWHHLGVKVNDNLSPEQMLKAAKCDWTVSKRPMAYKDKDGKWKTSELDYALVRDDNDFQLSTVGDTWKPVQNAEGVDFFKKWVKAGHMKMETLGALWYGRYVWALARVGKDFSLGSKDEIHNYLLLALPHVHGKAIVIQFTSVRVVCWNTFSMALGADLKGKGDHVFRMPHSMTFDDHVKEQAEIALGIAQEQVMQFKEAATLLSKKKIKAEKVEEYFMEVLKFDPKKAEKKKTGEIVVPRLLPKFQAALIHAPGQHMATAEGTMWGAWNAVTAVIDHQTGRDRGTALKNAWLGNHAATKRRAFDLALDYSK